MAESHAWCLVCVSALLCSLFLGLVHCQGNNGQAPKIYKVVADSHSLEVFWTEPNVTDNTTIDSYRVRVYQRDLEEYKQVFWLPPQAQASQAQRRVFASCLEADTEYVVVVHVRFSVINVTKTANSQPFVISTLAEKDFFGLLWDNRLYAGVGAAITAALALILGGVICCCCACKPCCCSSARRKFSVTADDGCGLKSLPSVVELQTRPQQPLPLPAQETETRYTPDPTLNKVSTSGSRSPLIPEVQTLSASYASRTSSMPMEQAPRPPPWGLVGSRAGNDAILDEKLEAGNEDGHDLYANWEACKASEQQEEEDLPVYGNLY